MQRLAVRSGALGLAAALVSACGAGDGAPERIGTVSSPIVAGAPSPASQDYVVRINVDTAGKGIATCSGVLVAPTLVLAAAHCFEPGGFETNNDLASCQLGMDAVAANLATVTIGASLTSTQTVSVKAVFLNENTTDCHQDVAMVVLERAVTGVTLHPLLLDSLPPNGEPVTAIGFGVSDDQGDTPSVRQQQQGKILSNNGGTANTPSGKTVSIPNGYIVTSNTACDGDSGGAIVDSSGSLVGLIASIVSTGQITFPNGETQSDCADSVLASPRLSDNVSLIEQSFQSVGLMPWRAGRPAPPANIGATCTLDNECNSNYCVEVGSQGVCSMPCTKDSDCPASYACTDTGLPASSAAANGSKDVSVCLAPTQAPKGHSCSISNNSRGFPVGELVLGALTAALVLRRRRTIRDGL